MSNRVEAWGCKHGNFEEPCARCFTPEDIAYCDPERPALPVASIKDAEA